MTLGVALCAAIAAAAGHGRPPDIAECGRDPARGLLVNCTIGAAPWAAPDPARPTVVFVHGANPLAPVLHFAPARRMAEAVYRRHGGRFNVLGWDWNSDTIVSLSPRANVEHAVGHGYALASALRGAGVDPVRLHLIGQSSGCVVAAAAARALIAGTGRPVAQLTLIDPATLYHGMVFEQLAAGSTARLVENYYVVGPSGFGRAVGYPDVWNIQIDGRRGYVGLVRLMHSDHLDAVRWYIASVEDPSCCSGFNTSLLLRSP